MKKLVLLTICVVTVLALFASCTSSNAKAELPLEISQDDWACAKQFVNLSTGIKMAYVEMGDPDGEVVILQHGMTDNSRSWSLAAPYFTKAGYHVFIPDLRGMGKSDAPDGYYTTVTYATDMKAFFDAVGIEKAIVIGHSLGSFTVQTFALMFPERCSKVVLVSSIPIKDYQSASLQNVYNNYINPIGEDEHPSDEFMDLWYGCTFKEDNGAEIEFDKFLAALKSESKALSKSTWQNIIFGLMASNLKDVYSQFDTTIPVLLLHGSEDTMTKDVYQQELMSLLNIPETGYRNYEGVGHNIQFEITKQSSEDILYWLANGVLPE